MSSGDDAYIPDGREVTAYALSPQPAAFERNGAGTGTSIYGSGDSNLDTEIYGDETNKGTASGGTADGTNPSFCPQCGESLTAYDEVRFCPHCGFGL